VIVASHDYEKVWIGKYSNRRQNSLAPNKELLIGSDLATDSIGAVRRSIKGWRSPMALQPIISKPGAASRPGAITQSTQRVPIPTTPQAIPLWVPLMMVFVTALSVVALTFSILKAPATSEIPSPGVNALNITEPDASIEEGKEVQVKILQLEKNLSLAKTEIQRLNEELLQVRSTVDGLNANVTIVQNQSAKLIPPVNISKPQPEN
jgi:hypothetical protein